MKTLKKFEFKQSVGKALYDWDKLLDGGIYELSKGEGKDFTCNTQTIRMMAYKQAEKRGLGVRVHVIDGEEIETPTVTLQAYEMTAEEKEEKQKNREARKATSAKEGGETVEDSEEEEQTEDEEVEQPEPKARGKRK